MALIKCPDCEQMISPRVKQCPFCGCPSEFFGGNEQLSQPVSESAVISEDTEEPIVFTFKQFSIKYPANSEVYMGLYGDYVQIGFEKFETLCNIYKNLRTADAVANNFAVEAQKIIDEQINEILKNLYDKGLSMTRRQFKDKYGDKYPLDYIDLMEPFMENYNNIIGLQQDMAHSRAVAYSNRRRWVGGGFGMKGAVKGAMQAGVLNAGSSILSGIGNMAVASLNEGSIEKRKEKLYCNEAIMLETCEGIITCMNGLFLAYTEELDAIGKLGNKINIDFEQANAKFEAAMAYEKDKEKLFGTVVECLGLYPSSREFYEAIGIELEGEEDWKAFKEYWHLSFLYKEAEAAYIITPASLEKDGKSGSLKLLQNVLIFTGDNAADSKNIPIGSIKSVDSAGGRIQISIKNKFLMEFFYTPINDTWVHAIRDAIEGRYVKINARDEMNALEAKKKEATEHVYEVKDYINANFSLEQRAEAETYARNELKISRDVAKRLVNAAFIEKKATMERTDIYPGTEEIRDGIFEGKPVALWAGDDDRGYFILTTKEIIVIDVKHKKDERFDIYKISKLEVAPLGMIAFEYSMGFMLKRKRHVSALGLKPAVVIEKIQNMQKGKFKS